MEAHTQAWRRELLDGGKGKEDEARFCACVYDDEEDEGKEGGRSSPPSPATQKVPQNLRVSLFFLINRYTVFETTDVLF